MTAPDRAFLPEMLNGVAQVNSDASENARLVYQPQRAQTAVTDKKNAQLSKLKIAYGNFKQ